MHPMKVHIDWIGRLEGGAPKPFPDETVTWLDQVHGAAIVAPTSPGEHRGARADAAVTATIGAKLLVRTADCAPVHLTGFGPDQNPLAIGVVHAGWRGLVNGVIPAAVGAIRGLGASHIRATLYPCIGPECYEFGGNDLDAVARVLGEEVRARTSHDTPALNVPVAVRQSLTSAGVDDYDQSFWACTACNQETLYSHRARVDRERMGLLSWLA